MEEKSADKVIQSGQNMEDKPISSPKTEDNSTEMTLKDDSGENKLRSLRHKPEWKEDSMLPITYNTISIDKEVESTKTVFQSDIAIKDKTLTSSKQVTKSTEELTKFIEDNHNSNDIKPQFPLKGSDASESDRIAEEEPNPLFKNIKHRSKTQWR